MKKQDLKENYTVIYRNGKNRIFNNGDFFYNGMRRNNIMNYSDDLLHVASDRFDIMSVIRDGVTIWTREETATLEEIMDMFIESKMKDQSEDRKAEYKQKKESGAYDYEAQEHDLTLKVKQMATVVCKLSKRADEN